MKDIKSIAEYCLVKLLQAVFIALIGVYVYIKFSTSWPF